ncbi:cytochrome P450 isoform 1 [Aphelenchoides avenae]|nr:cytochrome P450 isoform 1 [Aphelenchus avenae]
MLQAYDDLFQELINATLELNCANEVGMAGQNKKPISKVELIAQSMMVMAASYKTITTLLHIACTVESWRSWHIAGMTYLSQVINKTLPIAPPFTRTSRMCTIPITLEGIPFEAGTIAVMPIYAIHHNPQFYEDPEKFDPERFTAVRKAIR